MICIDMASGNDERHADIVYLQINDADSHSATSRGCMMSFTRLRFSLNDLSAYDFFA